MKSKRPAIVIVSISILTILIIGFSLFAQHLLGKESQRLETSLDNAVKCSYKGDWKAAETSLSEVSKTWSGVKGTWSVLIDHQEIDNIEVSLNRLKSFANANELPDTLSEAAALKTYFGHIPEREKLKLENLF